MDKAPQYQRQAVISILLANYFPKIKIIMTIRNPIQQMWSYINHFPKKYGVKQSALKQNAENERKRVLSLVWKNVVLKSSSLNVIRNACIKFNNDINSIFGLDLNSGGFRSQHRRNNKNDVIESLISAYKEFVAVYLYEWTGLQGRYFGNKYDYGVIISPMAFASILMYVYAYDEALGFGNWNQLRLIQSEFMFDHLSQSLEMIKCWLQTNKQINWFEEMDYNSCTEIYYNNDNYYHQLNEKLNDIQNIKINSKTHKTTINDNDRIVAQFKGYFSPCNDALYALIGHRNELLLGQWLDWGF